MRSRVLRTVVWVLVLTFPAAAVIGLYYSASAATARRHGGPLWLAEYGQGTLGPAHPDLWIGCGLQNVSNGRLTLESIDVIPVYECSPLVEVSGVFVTDLPVGCPPVNDDPRAKGVVAHDVAGFVIPARETRGAFLHFHLDAPDGAATVNVYRLRVTYRSGRLERVFEPLVYIFVSVSTR